MYTAPLHKRHKKMTAPLSKELMKDQGVKSLPIRKGDTVKIMRGDFKDKDGTVEKVNLKKYYIHVSGKTTKKANGSDAHVPIAPSNVMITKLQLKDNKRNKIIERSG